MRASQEKSETFKSTHKNGDSSYRSLLARSHLGLGRSQKDTFYVANIFMYTYLLTDPAKLHTVIYFFREYIFFFSLQQHC